MANVKSGNTWYIDSTGSLVLTSVTTATAINLIYLVLTPTAANGRIVLEDDLTGSVKLDFRTGSELVTEVLDLSTYPITFSNGINVATLTNAVATLVIKDGK